MRTNSILGSALALVFIVPIVLSGRIATADTLLITESRITASEDQETMPTVGNDGTRDLVVYTMRAVNPDGSLGPGDIWYQPLDNGAPSGVPTQVTTDTTRDEQLNDISGDYIVYTAYDSAGSNSGSIMLYQISDPETLITLGSATIIQEPRIHGNWVVWREGGAFAAMVKLYDLTDLGTGAVADTIAGPVPPTFDIQIGSRFAVWSELDGDYDVLGHDLIHDQPMQVTDTADVHERNPATSGAWVVWQEANAIRAKNMDTLEERTIVSGPASNENPSIDGDLVMWESDATGNLDIWVYRISTGERFQVTTDPNHQYLNDVFGDMVAYVDMRLVTEDVYVSLLEFLNAIPVADAGLPQTVHPGTPVTLDGSGSYDPDGDVITYAWTLQAPVGSTAALVGADTVTPSFTPDLLGDYQATLVVTDSGGAESLPDTVTISTFNTAPVADAGPDQALIVLGDPVTLGTDATRQSYDPDGDAISYDWALVSRPEGSTATLDDPFSATPSFVPDQYGDYVARLEVIDSFDAVSDPDYATLSFSNVAPVADAGGNQAVDVYEVVVLDGQGSADANGDPLTYDWNFVSRPDGSTAMLSNASEAVASFVADMPGTYVVSLVVNDGLLDSEPDNATVVATATQAAVIDVIRQTQDVINGLPKASFKNKNMAKTLTNKLNATLALIDEGQYEEALAKLRNDVLKKSDGCAVSGAPDKNDWITTCDGQGEVYPLIIQAIAFLEALIAA